MITEDADTPIETYERCSIAAVTTQRLCCEALTLSLFTLYPHESKVTSVRCYLWNVMDFAEVALGLALGLQCDINS